MAFERVPRTSFRHPFGVGFAEPLEVDEYDSENVVVGRTSRTGPPSAVFLGKLAEFERMRRNVWLDCHGAHAVYIVGKRRSGKSYTLGVLCEGIVANSWLRAGPPDQAVLLIDTLNIYGTFHAQTGSTEATRLWQLPCHAANVRYIAPEVTRPGIAAESVALTLDPRWLTLEDWCGLFDVDPFSDPLGHLLGLVVRSVEEQGASSSGSEAGLQSYLAALDAGGEARRFEDSTREALRRRFLALERLGIFLRPSLTVADLMTGGCITVCQLRDLDDRIRALIVAVLVREIIRARGQTDARARWEAVRARTSGREPSGTANALGMARCWIAIDEAHNYLPSGGSLPSRPVLRRLVTEGRNVGLSVVVATQEPSGLDKSIQRNADALLVHAMSMKDDILSAERMINTRIPERASWGTTKRLGKVFEGVVRSLPQGYCLVSTDTASRVFGLRVRPRITMHGGESY